MPKMLTDTLRMPEHFLKDVRAHGRTACRTSVVPGYAQQMPDGRLHCNLCGWVTPEPVITSYHQGSGNTYLTWDELVEAHANGYVVVGITDRPQDAPMIVGPYTAKGDAKRAQARLRRRWRHEVYPAQVRTYLRILWKDED